MLISEPNENRQERRATPEFLTEEPVFEMNLNQANREDRRPKVHRAEAIAQAQG
jgi:hypothetical protein